MAAKLTIGGENYYLGFDTILYGDQWYMLNLGGNKGAVLGISTPQGGLIPEDELGR